ncbi:flagellar motor switch protein FliM [uncultured Maritimibacter sp.]|jgi:flagellar motor switch protein FliM|uniref:flagellar motor switch protein FliM n=1 Tax=uncultured Maritimibacter sp. TaxID=991866 RepID=UPI0026189C60|nr:flagellar motor switch protein FliM [uncultured Maritimibacter sp.]
MAEKMTTDERPSAIRRKAGAGRPPPEIGAPTAPKLLRASIMQAAEEVAALTLLAGQPQESRTTVEPMVDMVPDHGLMALVEGPGGRYGLVLLDAQLVAALIEVQTMGKVVPRPAEPRPPTRTDAIMCADFVDRVLEMLEARAAEVGLAVAPALTGYRYALALAETRAIPMTLEDIPYRRFEISLDIAGGAKQGVLQVILPFSPAPQPAPDLAPGAAPEHSGFTRSLGEQVLGTEAELRGTLHRAQMTLAQALRLGAGSVLTLPAEALGQVAIEDIEGRIVARGRLGQAKGQRALRINARTRDEGPDFGDAAPQRAATVPAHHVKDVATSSLAEVGLPGSEANLGAPGDHGDLGDLGYLGDFAGADDFPDLDALPDLAAVGQG